MTTSSTVNEETSWILVIRISDCEDNVLVSVRKMINQLTQILLTEKLLLLSSSYLQALYLGAND